jgi:hypothetical protein
MNVLFASGAHLDALPTDAETNGMPVADASVQSVPSPSDRDERGRFKKGNGGGPGNPYARRCAHLRQLLHSASTDEEILEIFEVLKKLALKGDVAAIKLFLAYQIGKPTEAPDPDTLDQQELKIVMESHAQRHEEVNNIVHGFPAELLVPTSRKLVPVLAGRKQQILSELVRQTAEEIAAQYPPPAGEEDGPAAAPPMQTLAISVQRISVMYGRCPQSSKGDFFEVDGEVHKRVNESSQLVVMSPGRQRGT